eukprot:TRINITY_DN4391_c0_g2_i1.p1 TRINITY_DN4391_c0_g2~~TRINITY_DN4391_c0_g2_i1.p1  ORF type:complete len:399 (+),score=111.10 TRINITY_DN4391_c0_g2_i1:190-1386(+)
MNQIIGVFFLALPWVVSADHMGNPGRLLTNAKGISQDDLHATQARSEAAVGAVSGVAAGGSNDASTGSSKLRVPREARDCKTMEQLVAWYKDKLKIFNKYVPKQYAHFADAKVHQEYVKNKARIEAQAQDVKPALFLDSPPMGDTDEAAQPVGPTKKSSHDGAKQGPTSGIVDKVADKLHGAVEEVRTGVHSTADSVSRGADETAAKIKSNADETAEKIKSNTDKTAEKIKWNADEKAEQLKQDADETAEKIKEKADKTAEKIKSKTDKTAEKIKKKAETTAEKIKSKADKTAEKIKQAAQSAKDEADDVSDHFHEKINEVAREIKERDRQKGRTQTSASMPDTLESLAQKSSGTTLSNAVYVLPVAFSIGAVGLWARWQMLDRESDEEVSAVYHIQP